MASSGRAAEGSNSGERWQQEKRDFQAERGSTGWDGKRKGARWIKREVLPQEPNAGQKNTEKKWHERKQREIPKEEERTENNMDESNKEAGSEEEEEEEGEEAEKNGKRKRKEENAADLPLPERCPSSNCPIYSVPSAFSVPVRQEEGTGGSKRKQR